MASAKVQVTIVYEYDAEYDADLSIADENNRISAEAQDSVKPLVGSTVDIVKDGSTVVSNVLVSSVGLSVATVPVI